MRRPALRRALGAAALGLAVMAQPAAAASGFTPIGIETENAGRPGERVTRFTVTPGAVDHLLKGRDFLQDGALAKHYWDNALQKGREEAEAAAMEGWAWLNFGIGGTAAVGTLAEHGAKIAALGNTNTALTNLGGILAALQVLMDLHNLDNKAAGINAYKGIVGFAIGRFGTAAMQLGSVTFIMVDWSLNTVATQVWDDHTKMWERAYRNYYAVMDDVYAASTGDDDASLSARASAILNRKEAGRSKDDWLTLVSYYYRRYGDSPVVFKNRLDNDIYLYAKRAWTSQRFQEELRYDTGADTWTFGGGTSATIDLDTDLSNDLRAKIERRFRHELKAMLARDIFPLIARATTEKALRDEVAWLNAELRPELNAPLFIYVTTEGLEEPGRLALVKGDGSAWYGNIAPGESKRTGMTKIAFIRNGFPDTIRLHHADGVETETFTFDESDTATVHFVVEKDAEDEATPDEAGDVAEEDTPPPEGGHWVLVESFGKVREDIDNHECYDTSGSMSDGSGHFANVKPRCGEAWDPISADVTWTPPPAVLVPDQTYPMSLSLQADFSARWGGSGASLSMDVAHVECGYGTGASRRINEDDVKAAWNSDFSAAWSGEMTAPAKGYGEETDDGAIRFQIKADLNPVGCYRYIYEWKE
ncbi:hypothetical protein P1J78_01320 [Psychromarinibacter sp. C21-152]|uniref:Uncharacterized protein n=1 Tax=Psychromarinibacter sediminicola TaxID=3033385 RepID=A0AAE3NN71_9RHOB|nr:hypothetical protein [Psychromarinibacter sediminicola]MDF0599361.1 hypothetical protein [Psychromarinibacter sediminicola]